MAAVTLVEAVNKAYGIGIDTEKLKRGKKQIGLDFQELSDKYTEHKKVDSHMYM